LSCEYHLVLFCFAVLFDASSHVMRSSFLPFSPFPLGSSSFLYRISLPDILISYLRHPLQLIPYVHNSLVRVLDGRTDFSIQYYRLRPQT